MRRGFTLVELIVVVGIISALVVLGTVNLLGGQRKSALETTVTSLVTDLQEQRIKAMTGDTGGSGVISGYGVYFGSDRYVVFKGATYVAGDPGNFEITLDPSLSFTGVTWPGSQVVFAAGSGEAVGWTAGAETVLLGDAGEGKTKRVTINRYGTAEVTDE